MGSDSPRLEMIFAEAIEVPPEQRADVLNRACGDDVELRREVEELLAVEGRAERYFDQLGKDIAATAPLEVETAAQPKMRIGSYETVTLIGRGGMAVVHLAERVDGAFEQQVALKLLHRDMDTPERRSRFLAERQILAGLSHPNIAHLLDGGVTDEGRPYFVMEYVEGQPISRYCRDHVLEVEAILRLFLDVVDAVSYLHRNLVVHRDLKPSNIFVDGDGHVKLLDFGISKMVAEASGDVTATMPGQVLMTPDYAAPEQFRGAPVTTASDVYSLGVVLYELLTGARPHRRSSSGGSSDSGDLPKTPSSALRSRLRRGDAVGADDRTSRSPRPAWRNIPKDLDTICLAALHPEPEARYRSVEQFGRDIERFLEGRPVEARRSTLGYRFGKFVGRNRRGVAAALILMTTVVFWFFHERNLRNEAETARAEAEATSAFIAELISSVDPKKAQGREVTVVEILDQAAGRIDDNPDMAAQPRVEAAVRQTIGETYASLSRLEEARGHLERAFELRGGLDSRDPRAILIAVDLGVLYQRLGLEEESEALLTHVLDVRAETLGEEHPRTLMAQNHLADLMWSQGRLDEVERIDRKTLEIRRRVLGEDHPDTLRSLNALATTLFNRGAYREAAEFFERAYSIKLERLGMDHPDTLMLGNNLAAAFLETGRYSEAETLMRRIVEGRTRVFGAENLFTAMSVHNLGVTLLHMARLDEAERWLRQAADVRRRIGGPDSSDFFYSSGYLADVYREQGRFDEAERLYRETLEGQRRHFGSEYPDTLRTVSAMAELRIRQGRWDDAAALLLDIRPTEVKTLGEDHPATLSNRALMASIRNRQERFDEALALATDAEGLGTSALGAGHPIVLAAVFERAKALAGLGRNAEALELGTRVHRSRVDRFGDGHPLTADARAFLETTVDR